MATTYFDLNNVTNGAGTSADPKNLTGWLATTPTAGNSYLFKRGNTFSGAFTLTAGTAGNLITMGAWYNSDGTDDTTRPRPIFKSTTVLSSLGTSNKDYTSTNSLDIRYYSCPPVNDKNIICMGDGATINDCLLDTNVGCIGVYGKSNVTITGNTCRGVSHGSNFANNVISISDSTTFGSITISGNTVYHYGGGNSNSHGIRAESTLSTTALTNLNLLNNVIKCAKTTQRMFASNGCINEFVPNQHVFPNVALNAGTTQPTELVPLAVPTPVLFTQQLVYRNTNRNSIGVRLQRTPSAIIDGNTVQGFLEGIWALGGGTATALTISNNTTTWNRHFGIHLTTDAISCTVQTNTCSYNGININDGTLAGYGRGIEMSSAAGQARCANHIVKFNTCNNNFDYGGPADNGSEGVGIGLDDSVYGIKVYGNTCINNEGNGIQVYGGTFGSGSPAITDTGSHYIVANFFQTNCTQSQSERQPASATASFATAFDAHIGFATTYGSPSICANNVFKNGKVAIGQNASCSQITVCNNLLIDVLHGIKIPTNTVTANYQSNCFFSLSAISTIKKFCDATTDANSQPLYSTTTMAGINDKTFDPLISTNYALNPGSPAIGAGYYPGVQFDDFSARPFNNPPSIGMLEVIAVITPVPTEGGHMRKFIYHKR